MAWRCVAGPWRCKGSLKRKQRGVRTVCARRAGASEPGGRQCVRPLVVVRRRFDGRAGPAWGRAGSIGGATTVRRPRPSRWRRPQQNLKRVHSGRGTRRATARMDPASIRVAAKRPSPPQKPRAQAAGRVTIERRSPRRPGPPGPARLSPTTSMNTRPPGPAQTGSIPRRGIHPSRCPRLPLRASAEAPR
jgi:hypothetical protein